jgi:drug/metabolite transporter (DMT)-like permease
LRRVLPALVLVLVTAIWGWTFVLVRAAVLQFPVVSFLGIRFLLAAAVMWIVIIALRQGAAGAAAGLAVGAVLCAGYLFQTLGLRQTTVANTGLITGLFVVFTPLLDRLLFSVPIPARTWWAAVTAFAGTGLLTGGAPGGLHQGDLLVLVGSLAFALHIALLSRYARTGPLRLAAWQMTAVAVLMLSSALVTRSSLWPVPASIWPALLITGLLASALAFWAQTYAQQKLPASRAAVILTLEPAFTVVFAFWLAGERFVPLQGLGAVLILAALFYNEARLSPVAG